MKVAFDIDGTIDSFPRIFQSTMSAYKAAGHHAWIITGTDAGHLGEQDLDAKRQYLNGLGIGADCYDELVVCPDPHPQNKASIIADNGIELLFDNNVQNAEAARKFCAVLVLWNSKETS